MGYRSNGGMVIWGPEPIMTAHLFALRASRTDDTAWQPRAESGVRLYRVGADLVWHLEYSGWKWYSSYEHVQEYERIYQMSSEVIELSGYRWRVGENAGDEECDGFGNGEGTVEITHDISVNHRFDGYEPTADNRLSTTDEAAQ